jgi:ectoine hydroxylase-related dioxygenase (phytanoyl-CoA dioxygenase family)
MSVPWTENVFFDSILQARNDKLSEEQIRLAQRFHRDGYVIIDLELSDTDIEAVVKDMLSLALKEGTKKQEDGYHYNNSPRIFEGWRDSKNILQLSLNKKVLDTLRFLYGQEPMPFQTINFIKGTEQPLHSDTIHFHTIPHKWVTACWIALENMDYNNGPLKFIPQSHKLPIYTLQDLRLPVPEYGKQFESYAFYEDFIKAIVSTLQQEDELFLGRRGQALIWASNLLHGGSKVNDKHATRYSQVTHYYFEGCEHYYCPMFSNPENGIIAHKDLSTKKFQ